MYQRKLDLTKLLHKKSFFLFGPRSTGKTTLIEQQLTHSIKYDLLNDNIYGRLLRRPTLLEEENFDKLPQTIIVIDEIQKIPKLLDEVHRLIKDKQFTFLLSGSSARKLRKGGSNLLGGRAWEAQLMPLSFSEIPDFNLVQYLNRGGLPHVYPSADYKEELKSYVNLYLREEIVQEALVKKYEYFLRFLDVIALNNGCEINYESIARDANVPPRTVQNYAQILIDTLLVFAIHPYRYSQKRKATSKSKLYLFDLGVSNYLSHKGEIIAGGEAFGNAFEHFIINEIRTYLSYRRIDEPLTYWRTVGGEFEVDIIIGNQMAIEIKSTEMVLDHHLKGLRELKKEKLVKTFLVVSQDPTQRQMQDEIAIYPWSNFLQKLWNDEFITRL